MTPPQPTLEEQITLSRNGGQADSIGIAAEYSIPSNLTAFAVRLPPSVDIDWSAGFQAQGSKLTWDEQTSKPSMTGQYDPSRTSMGGYQAVDRGDWAVITKPGGGLASAWSYRGSETSYESTYDINGRGAISSDGAIAYLGPYERYTNSASSERLELIVPDAAHLVHSPEEILECIRSASRALDIGPRNDEVLMIAAPSSESNWGPSGTQFGDAGFWALDRTRLGHPNNTWVHEYVHTRQDFDWDDSMEWFVEGTANYFAAWATADQGLIDFDRFHDGVTRTTDPGATLSDPNTWANYQTKYTKGTVVTAALAAELAERSDGRFGLADLVRATCDIDSEEPLSVQTWQSRLDRRDLPDLSAWFARYVTGAGLPAPPNEPAAYGLEDITDEGTVGRRIETDDEEDDPETDDETSEPDSTKEESGDDERDTDEEREVIDVECPVCGTTVGDEETFCSECGTAVHRECFVCGAQAPGQDYCPICGTELVTACSVCAHKQCADSEYCNKCGTEL